MKRIFLRLLSTHAELGAPAFALFEIVPAQARKLLELHRRARAFLMEAAADGLVSPSVPPSFALPGWAFTPFNYSYALHDLMEDSADGVLVLQEGHDSVLAHEKLELHNVPDADDFRIHPHDGGLGFSCSFILGDTTVHCTTDAEIPIELLIRLANLAKE